jgi:nitric oxide reductase large subunit
MTNLACYYLFFAACMFLAAYNLADDKSFRGFAACLWVGLVWPVVIAVTVFERVLND